ncbi:tetratricopeptide repeat protein [Veronia nyctiphanis]|uniref:tetratricopeptide repeat protein n=1 Tax=Veronia nyctiphanis TaxID=1278244 RepID=UPI001F3858F0|nr:tetratricopeptide repeat protein [Veronia nyctiphanis]
MLAAKQDDVIAQTNLGFLYLQSGIKDEQLAFKWFYKAAEQGYVTAQHNIGVAFDQGIGTAPDAEKAAEWYREAALQGNSASQFNLGVMYFNGQGLKENKEKSLKWLILADRNGFANAREVRQSIAAQLQKSALDKAEKAADACLESGYRQCV